MFKRLVCFFKGHNIIKPLGNLKFNMACFGLSPAKDDDQIYQSYTLNLNICSRCNNLVTTEVIKEKLSLLEYFKDLKAKIRFK